MYLENLITSFPTLTTTDYLFGSVGVIGGEKLNGQNYFSRSQSIKMALKGRHKFWYPAGEVSRPRPRDLQERIWKGEDSLLRAFMSESARTSQPPTPTRNKGDLGTPLRAIAQLAHLPCAGNERIRIADRSFAPIAGKGHISPFDGLILQDVLHVPKISYNLLSIRLELEEDD
ncbi:reverse transcriptase [Cucumis melo var. makuwa]|uniref:Reverse transcriptase n=1 Tax=Cucumis melo var. makuwa TaxID=1194695 RepID=A0A5A7U4G3_CUCMM|nr:reverse transcriptase [Cucumis melo var. makuwa]TYK08573.1 reverse transcriptase [Cucumis melo var. makuwa]